jgi:hypothetical protein
MFALSLYTKISIIIDVCCFPSRQIFRYLWIEPTLSSPLSQNISQVAVIFTVFNESKFNNRQRNDWKMAIQFAVQALIGNLFGWYSLNSLQTYLGLLGWNKVFNISL